MIDCIKPMSNLRAIAAPIKDEADTKCVRWERRRREEGKGVEEGEEREQRKRRKEGKEGEGRKGSGRRGREYVGLGRVMVR